MREEVQFVRKKQHLILVGAGHAHLFLLKKLQEVSWPHIQVTLISPSAYQYYSGMFSGFAEGLYNLDQIRVDMRSFIRNENVRWKEAFVLSIDPDNQIVQTDKDDQLEYDWVSFDIGSLTSGDHIPGVRDYAFRIKPNFHFPHIFKKLRTNHKVAIVGGGASGTEMCLAIQAWRNHQGVRGEVHLISSGCLLEQYGEHISKKVERIVDSKGIILHRNQSIHKVTESKLHSDDGWAINYDSLLWLTGPQPAHLFERSHMTIGDSGYLPVDTTLCHPQYPNVIGAGDCIQMIDYPNLDKAGVYAVRQAPILWKNLLSKVNGESVPLISYVPQSHYLSILSTGNRQALLIYKKFSMHNRLAWRIKNRIDCQFMKRYQ